MTAVGVEVRADAPRTTDWWSVAGLSLAYLVTHAVLIYQSLGPATTGANDVGLYAWWMGEGVRTGDWVGIESPWVYPVGALVPMLVASVFGVGSAYLGAWCGMVALINLGTAVVVIRRFGMTRAAGPLTGWFVFLMLLGPCGIARLDAVMMPLVLIALVVAAARPFLASVLLTCSAWIKVSGGLVLVPLFAVLRFAWERWSRVVAPAALTCLVVVLLQVVAGGRLSVLTSFVSAETERGLQIEAVLATPVVLAHVARGEVPWVWNSELSTVETWGPGADLAIRISDIAMPLMVVVVGLLAYLARRRPVPALLVGALAMMSGLIVTHKVGSPQFVAWLAPPVVVALCVGKRWRFWLPVAGAVLVAAALTGLLYPWGYTQFLNADRPMLAVWVIRNVLVAAVFVAALVELVRLWRSPGDGSATIRGTDLGAADRETSGDHAHDAAGPSPDLAPSPTTPVPGTHSDPGAAGREAEGDHAHDSAHSSSDTTSSPTPAVSGANQDPGGDQGPGASHDPAAGATSNDAAADPARSCP
ncbi:MAG: hypothetical protein LBK95_19345 [Bifidobacteriaceae bacterium]|jgi:hypothetical protein|nr:hypothetical protein [Bifidobacteriaceae bacterium]